MREELRIRSNGAVGDSQLRYWSTAVAPCRGQALLGPKTKHWLQSPAVLATLQNSNINMGPGLLEALSGPKRALASIQTWYFREILALLICPLVPSASLEAVVSGRLIGGSCSSCREVRVGCDVL